MKKIPIAQPSFLGNEKAYVNDCLDSTWISSQGKYIGLLEKAFAEYCGVKHAVVTNNGTTALHLALVALGLKEGDEVIIPTVTYIATANAVRYCGAKPVLVDVLPGTLNIDPEAIAKKVTSRTKGIIPVHLYGHPADMKAVNVIAEQYGLWVLEDSAEAHGAGCYGKRVGGLSTCAAFSFFGNKIITTGEGGAVTTNDDALADKLRLYRGQGMDPNRRYWFTVVGYNYRMTNIQAAIGLAQLENIDGVLEKRAQLMRCYDSWLRDADGIQIATREPWAETAMWMYTVYLTSGNADRRDAVMQAMAEAGIETRPVFHPMHHLPPYFEDAAYPVADTWAQRGINLPTHCALTEDDCKRISEKLIDAIKGSV